MDSGNLDEIPQHEKSTSPHRHTRPFHIEKRKQQQLVLLFSFSTTINMINGKWTLRHITDNGDSDDGDYKIVMNIYDLGEEIIVCNLPCRGIFFKPFSTCPHSP